MNTKLVPKLLCTTGLAIGLAGCGGSSHVPSSAVQGSGIVATSRVDNTVTLLYQKSSTSDHMLTAEASSVCGKIGRSAGVAREVSLSRAGRIPGVDGKVIYQCL